MQTLGTLIAHDARLQYRYGIYPAYAVVVALYVALLQLFGTHLPPWLPAVIIFTDPAALGFFFLGALMMLERSEGVRAALAITPMTSAGYFASKATTLTGMALVACTAILLASRDPANPPLLLLSVALTSIQYVGLGVPIALRFKTVNGYLIGSAILLTPVVAPGLLALLDPFPTWLLVVPAVAQQRLMLISTGTVAGLPETAVALAVATTAAIGAVWFALASLRRELGK